MRLAMSYKTRRELLIQNNTTIPGIRPNTKRSILDEFVASTRLLQEIRHTIALLEKTSSIKRNKKTKASLLCP